MRFVGVYIMNEENRRIENIELVTQDAENQDISLKLESEVQTSKGEHATVLGTAVTGFIFTMTVVFFFVGFIISLISVVRGKT